MTDEASEVQGISPEEVLAVLIARAGGSITLTFEEFDVDIADKAIEVKPDFLKNTVTFRLVNPEVFDDNADAE